MSDRPVNILVVQANDSAAPLPALPAGTIEHKVAPFEALGHLDGDAVDLIVLDFGSHDADGLTTLDAIRQRAPLLPIIVVTDSGDGAVALSVLRAGAQDCLTRREMEEHRSLLARAVRFAFERNTYLSLREQVEHETLNEQKFQTLLAIFGSSRVPITERSLGQTSLRERQPADFARLVHDYGRILDDMVSPVTVATSRATPAEEATMALNTIADQLGTFGAGPRDVVDLHKAALVPRIEVQGRQAGRQALNYIEEGKLLVLRLMGQLVSFYRSLSWVTKPATAAGRGRAAAPGEPPIKDR